jgi:acetylornithine deacetylase/succinyl-diaminopimelate desuccinylase-like protein
MNPAQTKETNPTSIQAMTAETVDTLSRLLQVNTTNPPGNELPAILLIREILEANGFPQENIQIIESGPNRANLIARLTGDGSQRPLMLSGHVDVVPVEPERWEHDPFGGEVINGEVWGRGALDMKGFVAMYLQAFLQAFRQKLPLKRDLVFAAIADEEAGFNYGSKYLVDHHLPLIDAEYAFTEGGAMTVHMGKMRLYPIQVAEKGITWLKMSTQGQPGHGSMPHTDNAVLHLAQAIDRIRRAGRMPVHLTPTFLSMLTALSSQLSFPTGAILGLLRSQALIGLLVKALPEKNSRLIAPMLSNTVTPTVMRAGSKTNVIPSVAEVHLDCRMLPGQTPESVMQEIIKVTGKQVKLEILTTSAGTQFSLDTPLYGLLSQATKEMDPQGLVVPMMSPGATDASEYQRAGITVYGFTPGKLPPDYPLVDLGHGHNERLPISFIESGLPVLLKVIREFCG